MTTQHKHYYAASSSMGLNYTWDSPCWSLFAFDSKKERDEFADDSETHQSVSLADARKISPWLNTHGPHEDQQGYYTNNTGREVRHI